MLENGNDFTEEEYEVEVKPLTFDDMVSFTMFIEVSIIAVSIILFLFYLYLTL